MFINFCSLGFAKHLILSKRLVKYFKALQHIFLYACFKNFEIWLITFRFIDLLHRNNFIIFVTLLDIYYTENCLNELQFSIIFGIDKVQKSRKFQIILIIFKQNKDD